MRFTKKNLHFFCLHFTVMAFLLITTFMYCCPILAKSPILEQLPLPNHLGTYRHTQFKDTDLYTVTLNNNYQGEIYQQQARTQLLAKSIRQLSLTHNFLIAINGGYYTPKFQPAGLFIYQNKVLHPLATKDPLLTACVGINKDKKVFLSAHRENCLYAFSSMQSGPVLIQGGNLSNYLSKPHPKAKTFLAPHRRTIIALSTDNQLIMTVTSRITLLNLAMLLKKQPALFGVKKVKIAINLDGGSSTSMYIRFNHSSFYFPERKNVKTFLFFI